MQALRAEAAERDETSLESRAYNQQLVIDVGWPGS